MKRFAKVNAVVFAMSVLILIASAFSQSFSDIYSRSVGAALRLLLSCVSALLPFSLAELLAVVFLPLFVVFSFVQLVRLVLLRRNSAKRYLCLCLGIITLCGSLFINAFGVCYGNPSLERRLGLKRQKLTSEQLYMLCEEFSSILEKDIQNVYYDESGASKCLLDWNSLNNAIDKGYNSIRQDYAFLSYNFVNAKRILLSPIMTYTHISGMYMPITGEANVNTNYPDYVVAFSTAHEKAHQRGIAGEDEANFIAYLACINSGNEYLSYCAHMSMYDFLLSALSRTDLDSYKRLISQSPKQVLGEMIAYSEFFQKYRDSAVSKVADTVNDTYLKSLGQDSGVQSYGLVVELMASYVKQNGIK